MHKLVREMAVARISSFEARIVDLDFLQIALVIDAAAKVVCSQLPGALYLVRTPLSSTEISDWISNSSESGRSEAGDSEPDYHRDISPHEFMDVRDSNSYKFALLDSGLLRPLEPEIELLVKRVTGKTFNSLIELAHDNQLGAHLYDLSPSTEMALRMVGWDSLVRTQQIVEADAENGKEGANHTSMYWLKSLLSDWGPHLLNLSSQLVDTDARVTSAYAAVGERKAWAAESLETYLVLARDARADLKAARIDLIEIDVRTILDLSGTVGEPTAMIVAVLSRGWELNWTGEDDLSPERWLVPIRILSGSLPVFDFFNFEHESPTTIAGMEWNLHDNSLNGDLQEIHYSGMVRLDGIEIDGIQHSVVIDGDLYDDFRLIEFDN